ncbi:hypothetical protein LB505_003380 [Fusarium chuoi]|nr:hypothetical protein LB505_003380 [Fusarium chuoi]
MQSSKQLQIPLAKPKRAIKVPTAGLFGCGSGAIFRRDRNLRPIQEQTISTFTPSLFFVTQIKKQTSHTPELKASKPSPSCLNIPTFFFALRRSLSSTDLSPPQLSRHSLMLGTPFPSSDRPPTPSSSVSLRTQNMRLLVLILSIRVYGLTLSLEQSS